MQFLLFGPAGCGKTTLGTSLAAKYNLTFVEADDFHSRSNRSKMEKGTPLTEEDRKPWLKSILEHLLFLNSKNEGFVLACSALKEEHREFFLKALPNLQPVFLKVPKEVLKERLESRKHFFSPELLDSQLETLESNDSYPILDSTLPEEDLLEKLSSYFVR